jgi:hypothetical protein
MYKKERDKVLCNVKESKQNEADAYEASFVYGAGSVKIMLNKTFRRGNYAACIAVLFCNPAGPGEDCLRTGLEMAEKGEAAAKL